MFEVFSKIGQSPYCPSARTLLITSLGILMIFSLLMIASASVPFAARLDVSITKYFWSQIGYITIGIMVGYMVYKIPPNWYLNHAVFLLWLLVIVLLISTAMFGQLINGSRRWLDFGIVNFQTAELAKMVCVIIVSEYVVRRSAEVRESLWQSWRLLIGLFPILLMLIIQPDYGSVVVISATAVVILFISGAPIIHQLFLLTLLTPVFILGIYVSDYRSQRMMSFMDPFDDMQATDYQLSRSLIAFGRGQIDGVGYGNSVQKLAHLPEAHTDFLLAITGEELGVFGVLTVLILQACIIGAMMKISHNALKRHQLRISYMCFGFAVVVFGQVFINAGMNMGILPTKGLTMPFFSYGGSSLLMMLVMVAMVLRVDKDGIKISELGRHRDF